MNEPTPPDTIWLWRDEHATPQLAMFKPPGHVASVEYLRRMSRREVESLASSDEGVDPIQLIRSLQRRLEGQARHITTMQAKAEKTRDALERASNMLSAIAGDMDDGNSFDTLRSKYLQALVGARDDAREVLK